MAEEVTEILTLDTARVLNQELNEWEEGYLMVYKRHRKIQVVDGVTYPAAQYSYTEKIKSRQYGKLSIFARKYEASADGLYVILETSHDGVNWYEAITTGDDKIEIILTSDVHYKKYRHTDIEAEYIRLAIYPDVTTMALWVDIILAT